MMFTYKILDIFFVSFHTLLILFNLFGWIWKKTRRWNLATILLTAGSWVILGFFYGFGYCPLTDWHFRVLTHLGKTDLPVSYVKYLADRLTGMEWNSILIDRLTLYSLLAALILSLCTNFFLKLLQKKHR